MSTLTPAESRRQYSWWWGSHNSPKNSKWLQDNLSDMDLKVKAMIKLIEEDADSFARRAEMYYKKRPELMKFVEEFYRAYRALAERYNHATGALSHAHRTIAEAFPNHIPPVQSDESPSISPGTEVGPCTPASPLCLLFDPDDMQKDALGGPGYFYSANMNVGYVDDASFAAKRGLKQVNEMFAPREAAPHVKLHEGKVRKGLNFQEQEESISHSKVHTNESQILPEQEDDEKESTKNEIKCLQEEVSQLSIENKKLLIQIESESANSDLLRTEVQNLRDIITKLESEKQSILLQDKLSCEKISIMENEIFRAEYEFGKLHEEIMMVILKLCNTKEQCLLLEKKNQTLILDFERNKKSLEEIRSLAVENQNHWYQEVKENENAKKEMKHFHEQYSLLSNENDRIKMQLQNETIQLQLSRADVHNMKDAMSKLKSEKKASVLQIQLLQKNISSLESKSFQAKNEIGKLHTEIFMGIFKLYSAQEQYHALEKENQGLKSELEERKRVLEEIRKLSVESQSFLEQEIKEKENIKNEMECLQRDISQLSIENQNLMSQMASESKILGAYITEVQNLRDVLSVLECEKNDVILENQLSRECITRLGTEISRAKEEIRELHAEALTGIVKFCSAEEQKLALENAYDHMKSEIRKNKEGLECLRISLEESEKQRGKAERSLQSLERLYRQSQEKVEHMTVEIKTHFNKLKDTEHSKMSLEEEICQIKYVNTNLNERIIAYDSKLKHLQAEIVSLNSINCNLEDEINIHLEDNKVLQQELECIINDRNELDIKHKSLMKQLEVASLNMESLEILVKELQFGCTELSEGCQKLEYEKLVLFNKVQDVESIYQKNAVLNNSLSDAMEKIRVLEDSCESFSTKSSILVVEKAALASQIEVITGNMKILSEKNTILENSITNMSTQLEGLRLKLTVLQDSNQLLFDDNSNLIIQKNASISQVESIQSDLINLETKHAMLGVHYLNLEKEKDISVSQITELEVALDLKNKEHTSLMQTSKISLVTLENQIHLLQEDKNFMEEELEVVQQKCMSNIIENLILHTCLSDMKDSFRIEKQEQEFFIQSNEMQLTALKRQINLLCEKGLVRDKEFDEEEHKYMSSMLENFFLVMCLSEMNEKKIIVSQSCLQHMEAFRRAGELISLLEGSKLHLEEKNTLLVEHNARLMHGIEILLESLNINKRLLNVDGSEDVFIQAIKGEINNLLACISDLNYDNQLLHTEFSVYHTILKRVSLEKVFLGQELGRMGGQVLVLQRDHDQLQERYEILGQDVSDKKQLNESLNSELESLSRLLSGLSKDFSNLREQNNALEEENSMIIEEATKLEHLYLFFWSSNAESLQSLKVLGNEIVSLVAVENDLKKETIEDKGRIRVVENGRKFLEESLRLLEEFRCRTTILEFDLFIARLFNEDLSHQVETRENLLKKKNMELLKAHNNLQCTQEELTKICTKFDAANEEVEEAKLMRVQFEDKIAILLEGYSYKGVQIINTYEENRKLNVELNNLNDKVEVLRKSEHNLSSELQNKMDELDICEGEISNLFNEVQVSAVNNAFFEENMFEWAISSEFFDICALVQREMLNEGITLRNAHAFELKKKYDDLENENRELKAIWSSCLPLFISLDNGIAAVEKQARQLASLHEGQDTSLIDTLEKNIKETRTGDIVTVAETLELQNLVSKVRALEKLLTNTSNQLKLARLIHASNLEASKKEIEGLNMEETSDQDEYSETSRTKNGQLMKDIELDQVSNSNVLSRIQSAESEDQMLKLWETAEKDYSNSVSNRHGIEPVEEFSIGFPSSELIAEKELGVDKPEMPTKGSQEDWIRRIIERLSTDADKLSALKTTVKELEKKIENFGKSGKSSELDAVQIKVKQAEKDILELVETEEKLRKKVDDYSKSSEKMRWLERRQMFEQARTVSDQIEKLETELQEIYYFIVNLDGVSERNKSQVRDRSPRVLLRDYIDGWRAGKARKKHDFCGCMRPKTEE